MLELGYSPVGTVPLAAPEFLTDPVVVVADPGSVSTGGPFVDFEWSFSQAESKPQAVYRVTVADDEVEVYDSGWLSGAVDEFSVDWDAAELNTQSSALKVTVEASCSHLGVLYGSSDDHEFEVDFGDPQCTIIAPGEIVQDADGVDVEWTFSDDEGFTQGAYRVRLIVSSLGLIIHDSLWVESTDTTYHIPALLSHGVGYAVEVQLKNDQGMRSE